MSMSTIPPSGLSLHGVPQEDRNPKQNSAPAVLFKLSEDLLQDVQKTNGQGLQFVTGIAPKIRLGKRTIDLTISPEAFRHELYSASTQALDSLDFAGIVGHRAELKVPERKQSLGSDAALAALQSTLASYKQEKQANSVGITNSLIAAPKNRFEANKAQKHAHRRGLSGSQHASPLLSAPATPRLGPAPTSIPSTESAARAQAMRTPLAHLLAMRTLSRDEIIEKTRIPKDDLDEVLQKIGKPVDGKWGLGDRAYKELDVWKFAYSTQDDRQAAIDNAIRAYDRQRIGKDDKFWQQLLPEDDRNKGIVLSKLHIGAGSSHLTPHYGASPLPHGDGEERAASAANTPRLGAGTPKLGAGKSDLTKRLLSKTPKQRALEEAKEKKRKEREAAAAASDKEGKPVRKKQATKANNAKAISAEFVQDSSEESAEGDVKATGVTSSSQPKARPTERKPATNAASAKPKARPTTAASPSSDATEKPTQKKSSTLATAKIGSNSARPSASATNTTSKSKPAAIGKGTPNGLSAPSSQQRSQLSPNKSISRPTIPSPLGAARPRVASDVSDRGAVGVQRIRQGAETPKGLGISNANGARKRHDTVTSNDSSQSSRSDRVNGKSDARKHPFNSTTTPRTAAANGVSHHAENGVKRKPVDSPSNGVENGHAVKHRKVESSSSHSQNSQSSGSFDGLERGTSSDSGVSVVNQISYRQGVNLAQQFHDDYYPKYAKLYDEQAAMERRGEPVPREERQKLWAMHRRLEQMKREIKAASKRSQDD